MRRVVVTGMGVVSPLGCGVETVWQRLLRGESGIGVLPAAIIEGLPGTLPGGLVPAWRAEVPGGFDPDRVVDRKEQKKMDRFILLALAAADEALAQAGWAPQSDEARQRTATLIASGIGGSGAMACAVRTTDSRGPARLSPFTLPSFLTHMAAGGIAIRHGFKGPIGAPATACAASVQAIGDAARLLRTGEVDVAVCGGTDACVDRVGVGSFAAARALSCGTAFGPQQSSRPFDQARDGFVIAEGAAVLVLEERAHALRRAATPLAELVGYGTCSDAHHLTCPPTDGNGAQRAMQLALAQAGITPAQVQHVNAHATSTPLGDASELAALRAVFGGAGGPAISATKSAAGHLLGAAGALKAIFTVLALRDQIAPATLNLDTPDALAEGLDLVRGQARPMAMDYAQSNGFGFGGVNASVVLRRIAEA
ncbi:MAG: 3-oxoacyl-[acyl-carrier-protein] synthase 2 [Stenotrophomonas maltophilia]|uniref:3-oxoacyl-[acyl-carrier-protein] synthase 2 n=1 Tax=Stenotrophomonas maltophilia TaxID=40324 RepID=A0A7V8JK46_STEMA|nr:MAG: 3-oxoacyl-[acyl-carrier-protein] synthase 2 [Stenotrophomonas maltophilia]